MITTVLRMTDVFQWKLYRPITCHLLCWLLNWLNHWMSKCLHQSINEPIMTNQAKFNVFHGPNALATCLLHLVHLQNPSQMSLLQMLSYHFQKSSIRLSCYRMHTTKLTLSSRMSCVCHFVWRIARVESSIAKWINHECLSSCRWWPKLTIECCWYEFPHDDDTVA